MLDMTTPAVFLGGPLNGRVGSLCFGLEPFKEEGTVYHHMTVKHRTKSRLVEIHVYCADSLYGTENDKAAAFGTAWAALASTGTLNQIL
jgi:hypothetical protein